MHSSSFEFQSYSRNALNIVCEDLGKVVKKKHKLDKATIASIVKPVKHPIFHPFLINW
jgi:hypothetical protein